MDTERSRLTSGERGSGGLAGSHVRFSLFSAPPGKLSGVLGAQSFPVWTDRDGSPPVGVCEEEMSETLQCTPGAWPWAQAERRSGPWVSPARGSRGQK